MDLKATGVRGGKLIITGLVATVCLLLWLLAFAGGSARIAADDSGSLLPTPGFKAGPRLSPTPWPSPTAPCDKNPAISRPSSAGVQPMATPVPAPDSYESDDAQHEAKRIVVNDAPQRHNFHIAGDEDWVKFWAWAGNVYTIRTFDLDYGCDTVLGLYDTEGNMLEEDDDGGDEPRASKIVWTASESKTYYVRVSQRNPAVGSNLGYSLQITDSVVCQDEFEPDNTWDAAKPIAANGMPQAHSFHGSCGGDEDWVKLQATAGTTYTVRTFNLSRDNDTTLELYLSVPDGTPILVAENDDSTDGLLESRIDWTASVSETYLIRVAPFMTSTGGCDLSYLLNVVTTAGTPTPTPTPTPTSVYEPDEYEPDDAMHEANPIAVNGASQDHNFHFDEDEDWVKFWAWAGNMYTIRTFNLGGGNDTTLRLYDAEGNKLQENDDDPDNPPASKIENWIAPESRTYFVRVARPKVGSSGYYGLGPLNGLSYSLEISETIPCKDEYEPDNTLEAAKQIAMGSAQLHNFHVPCFNTRHPSDTEDWVKFQATAGVTYTIKTFDLTGNNDTVLCLYDGDHNLITCNDDDPDNIPASKIVWEADADGTYYVQVSPFEPLAGGCDLGYQLEISFIAGPPHEITLDAAPSSLTVGETSTVTATVEDVHAYPVEDGTEVTLETDLGCFETPGGCLVSTTVTTTGGVATAKLTSTEVGTAVVTATSGSASNIATVDFNPDVPYTLTLEADPAELTVGETSTLTATVVDQYGNNVADGSEVTFEADDLGCFKAAESCVISTTVPTTNGVALAKFASQETGTATVTAVSGSALDTTSIAINPLLSYLPIVLRSYPNHPPNMPSNPTPASGATDQSVEVDLSWSGGDPDPGDTVTYDVYFGTTSPPPIVESNHPDTTYDPGTLDYDTTYYWYIVARDDQGLETTGPEWHFTTELACLPAPSTATCDWGESSWCGSHPEWCEPCDGHMAYGPLCSGTSYEARLCTDDSDDPATDIYYIDLEAPGTIRIDLDVPETADFDLYLYYEEYSPEEEGWVAMSINAGEGTDEHIDYTAVKTGRYYIEVWPYEGSTNDPSADPYILTVTY